MPPEQQFACISLRERILKWPQAEYKAVKPTREEFARITIMYNPARQLRTLALA